MTRSSARQHESTIMLMLVTRKKYDADMAAKDAEIADLKAWLENSQARHALTSDLLRRSEERNGQLRRDLAKFTAPRARGAGGRFLPVGEVAS